MEEQMVILTRRRELQNHWEPVIQNHESLAENTTQGLIPI